jgi:hypothetical protein
VKIKIQVVSHTVRSIERRDNERCTKLSKHPIQIPQTLLRNALQLPRHPIKPLFPHLIHPSHHLLYFQLPSYPHQLHLPYLQFPLFDNQLLMRYLEVALGPTEAVGEGEELGFKPGDLGGEDELARLGFGCLGLAKAGFGVEVGPSFLGEEDAVLFARGL